MYSSFGVSFESLFCYLPVMWSWASNQPPCRRSRALRKWGIRVKTIIMALNYSLTNKIKVLKSVCFEQTHRLHLKPCLYHLLLRRKPCRQGRFSHEFYKYRFSNQPFPSWNMSFSLTCYLLPLSPPCFTSPGNCLGFSQIIMGFKGMFFWAWPFCAEGLLYFFRGSVGQGSNWKFGVN